MHRTSLDQVKWLLIFFAYMYKERDRLVLAALCSESSIPCFHQFVNFCCKPWLLDDARHDSFDDRDVYNAFVDVCCHSLSVFVEVCVLTSCRRFSEDAPVCALKTVLQGISGSLWPCPDLLSYRFCSLQQWVVCWSEHYCSVVRGGCKGWLCILF